MAKRRKKAAYRRGNQNRFSMVLVVMVVALITAAVAMRSMELSQRLDVYAEREAELNQQIEAEERRAEEIENFRKYTQTKRYVEEVAKEKLGLVYEGEILFKEED
ncbi:MAG: septum formation initiator family protein [Acetatifactor sp.]|nr:septum formation initiator family protein [Acetatifactor sp.]MDE7113567.1 septum formation initiator family protein [Acetatifactor sp.]MDE7270403.1 septum formation initiator family protein [Acetatifactor sp.]